MWGNRCALCNEGGELHLHHRDYSRVGNEEVTDVIPLCKKHHEMFHEEDYQSPRKLELAKEYTLVDATRRAIQRLNMQLKLLSNCNLGTPEKKGNILHTLAIMEDQYKRLTGEDSQANKNEQSPNP
jgi:hypothetical protein